jgi:hypothetical protein
MGSGPLLPQRRIRVLCTGGWLGGGPELLHQLVHTLGGIGRDAAIVYFPFDRDWTTPREYERYQCPVVRSIEDEPDTVVVVPEVFAHVADSLKKAQPAIWWLSVDNYRGNFDTRGLRKTWWRRTLKPVSWEHPGVLHLCQSAYALDYVQSTLHGTGRVLSDFLADEYLAAADLDRDREDVVLFNTKKGAGATRRIMRVAKGVRFRPLVDMTRDEMRRALRTAKVYIDFGPHPGKDRIPREAAMLGCVVLVGRRGSAAFAEDVALPERYKLPFRPGVSRKAAALVADVLRDHPAHWRFQETYRDRIRREPADFLAQVIGVFGQGAAPGRGGALGAAEGRA